MVEDVRRIVGVFGLASSRWWVGGALRVGGGAAGNGGGSAGVVRGFLVVVAWAGVVGTHAGRSRPRPTATWIRPRGGAGFGVADDVKCPI